MGRAFSAAGATAGYAFAAGVESAATFESQLRTINTVAQVSDQELAAIGDGIQQIARDTGKSTEDLTSAYYDMVSAGLKPGAEAMEALSLSAFTSLGALGTTADSVDLLTTVLNAYGMETSESANVMDTFAKAVEVGKVTMDQIGASIADAAPMAAQMGIGIDEVSAAYGFMTARGVGANEVMTQMSGAMRALINPNEELNRIQERTGLNFKEIAQERGLHVALEELRKVTGFNEEALTGLAGVTEDEWPDALRAAQSELGLLNSEVDTLTAIAGKDGASAAMNELTGMIGAGESAFAGSLGRVEAFRFALSATGDNFDEYGAAVTGMGDVTGTVMGQAEEAMKGPQNQADRLTQNITTFMQDVAGPFAGTMGPVLLTLNNLGPAFLGPLSPARMLGAGFGWLATKGLGGLIKGLGGGITALGNFGITLAKGVVWTAGFAGALIKDGLTALGNFVIRLGTSAARMVVWGATTVAHGVASVAKFAAALLIRGVTALGTFAVTLLTGIGRIAAWGAALAVRAVASIATFAGALLVQGAGALVAFSTTIFTTAIPAIVALAAPFLPIIAVIGVVVAVVGGLFLAWQNNFLGIRDIAATVWDAITGFISGAIDFISGVIGAFLDFLGGIWNGTSEAASGAWQAITGVVGAAVDGITGIISGIVDVAQGVWSTVSGIFGAIGDAAAGVGNAVGGVGDFFGGLIPQFEQGTMDTGRGGLALLHPHEAVLPQEVASALRGWLGSGAGTGASQQSAQAAAPSFTVNVYGGNTITERGATRELRRMVALS